MAQQPNQPLFGIVPAGQPLITVPSSQPSATSFLYAIPHPAPSPANPTPKPFAHLAVFLLPGVALPDGTAAAIYVALNPTALASGQEEPNFKFLGGVGPGKESAVFKLSPPSSSSSSYNPEGVIIGIGVEDASSVAERIQQLHATDSSSGHTTLQQQQQQPSTQILAQRIIQNAFNFLAGFSGKVGTEGVEVVPLKAFQEWWRKFENKVRNDPTFLEREQD
ncbi:Protein OPI10 [Daldinia childiae]|uniref:Protein OPI10 n=1 Tax=Daldinia childiae TaxID=326645 RepID=UPI001446BEE6|nr:Protein OPI10 [Daldinia childiae]KAF3061510.1 Protein OPI10 [Daldinia childiae]